ncbi:MAG: hypothetical protein DKT66_14155 [Candidatus Melainabacteria bacterium]|nr:MAG: hypothetical protein DKT66_14155 [Candidatus Melainabacteria bacterium]
MTTSNNNENKHERLAVPNSNFGVGLLLLVLLAIWIAVMSPKTGDNIGYPDNQRMVGGAQ